MAITAGRASGDTAQTVASATWTNILPTSYFGCEEIVVKCPSGSAAGLRVAAIQRAAPGDSIHRETTPGTPDDYFELAVGESITFAGSIDNKITKVYVAGDGGTADVDWTVTKQ